MALQALVTAGVLDVALAGVQARGLVGFVKKK